MGARQGAVVEFQTIQVQASLTRPANTTTYASGDAVSDATGDAHLTFVDALKFPNLSGSVSSARIVTSANQVTKPDLELFVFSSDIANTVDNAAFSPSDAEMLTLLGVIEFPVASFKAGNSASGASGNAVCEARNLGMVLKGSEKNLYGQLVLRNAYAPVSGEVLTVQLLLTQD